MSVHTPGPWSYRGTAIYGAGCKIGEAPSASTHSDSVVARDHARANAQLMAAAPELLAACKAVMAQFEAGALQRNTDNDGCEDWAIKAIEPLNALSLMAGAIAKAEPALGDPS